MPDAPLPNCLAPDNIDIIQMGMHSGLATTMLPKQQVAFAVNITARGGHASTRPPIQKLSLSYASADVQINLRAAFQGAAFYRSIGNNPSCLVASIGGHLFRFTVTNQSAVVDEITPLLSDGITLDVNDPNQPQAWLAQGQDFLVVQDGQSNPWFFDGASVKRSSGSAGQQLPPGRQVHYVNGRFIVALPDGISFIASDLVYNTASGTPAYNYRDSILRTTDNAAILAGQAFAVPVTAGPITALFSTAISDTSLGQGPLQVATPEGIYSVLLPLDATLWTTTQQPTSVVALPNGGPTGQYAVTTVNGDAWYRASDGIRSFVIARRDFNTWVLTPLSYEMQRILPFDQQNLLNYASTVNFNNRLLTTCSPYVSNGRGVAHRGLVALDFNNISSLTTRSQPAYDGLWTGLPILQILKGRIDGVERCFIFAIDDTNNICLYELGYDDAGWFDWDGEQDVPIESYIESGALFGREDMPDKITQPLKKLITADLWLESLVGPTSASPSGTIEFNLSYRSDQYPFWVDWHDFTLCARACYTPTGCSQPLPVQTQYATFKRLPEPADAVCNELTGRPFRFGYFFELKFSCTGHFQLHRLNLWVTPAPSTRNVLCAAGECRTVAGCLDSPFTYVIEPGEGTAGLLEWSVEANAPTYDTANNSVITPV